MHFFKVPKASTKGFPSFPWCSVSFPEVRQASRGADLGLGILEVAHQRPREFSRCDGIFWIRPGAVHCLCRWPIIYSWLNSVPVFVRNEQHEKKTCGKERKTRETHKNNMKMRKQKAPRDRRIPFLTSLSGSVCFLHPNLQKNLVYSAPTLSTRGFLGRQPCVRVGE